MILTEYNEELHNKTLREEGQERILRLYSILEKQNRLQDFKRAIVDKEFCNKLIMELRI